MSTPREQHTATLLPDGTVLITGGLGLKSAELFDPATDSFTRLPDMYIPRYLHSAILLHTGKVLLVGGGALAGNNATELYDPETRRFTRTGDLNDARISPSATLLADGRVLVTGGFQGTFPGNALSTAELYDPSTGVWTRTGSMNSARSYHSSTLFPDGRVLLAGGVDATYNSIATAEVFDSTSGSFIPVGSMSIARDSHTPVLLPDGSLLILGGNSTTTVVSGSDSSTSATNVAPFELFDPRTNSFHPGDETPPISGEGISLVTEPDGLTCCFLGSQSWTYHPAVVSTGVGIQVRTPALLNLPPAGQAFLDVTVTGASDPSLDWTIPEGASGGEIDSHGRYTAPSTPGTYHVMARSHQDPSVYAIITLSIQATGQTLSLSPASINIVSGSAVQFRAITNATPTTEVGWTVEEGAAGGSVDGYGNYTAPAAGGVYHLVAKSLWDPSVQTSATISVGASTGFSSISFPDPVHDVSAVPLLNGDVLISGGASAPADFQTDVASSKAYLFQIASGALVPVGSMLGARQQHSGVLLPDGTVLVSGGRQDDGQGLPLFSQEAYTPGVGFTSEPGLLHDRALHEGILLPDDRIFIGAGYSTSSPLPVIFDRAHGTYAEATYQTGVVPMPGITDSATLLPDGRILILGGGPGAYLFDPATNLITALPNPIDARYQAAAVLMLDGRVLIVGGSLDSRAEIFDPATMTFTSTGLLRINRLACQATLLPNGNVLITGGQDVNSYATIAVSELYDPIAGVFSTAPSLQVGRTHHKAVLLSTGDVLVIGGMQTFSTDSGSVGLASMERFNTPVPPEPTVTVLPNALRVIPGASTPLRGIVMGTANLGLNWSVQEGAAGGSVTSQGVYTAPTNAGTYHVVATSQADPTKSGSVTVTVQ